MLRIATALLVIFAIISLPVSRPVFAQIQVPADEITAETSQGANASADLKKTIAQNDRKYRELAAAGDVKALEKLGRQTTNGNGFTRKEKMWIAVGVVALAALVFVLVKYGKDCETTSPANCNLNDDNCTCTKYKQNL